MRLSVESLNTLAAYYHGASIPEVVKGTKQSQRVSVLLEWTLLWYVIKDGGYVFDQYSITDDGKKELLKHVDKHLVTSHWGERALIYYDKSNKKGLQRLAYLSFGDLRLYIEPNCPEWLKLFIIKNAEAIQSKKGQPYAIPNTFREIILGHELKK